MRAERRHKRGDPPDSRIVPDTAFHLHALWNHGRTKPKSGRMEDQRRLNKTQVDKAVALHREGLRPGEIVSAIGLDVHAGNIQLVLRYIRQGMPDPEWHWEPIVCETCGHRGNHLAIGKNCLACEVRRYREGEK